MDISEIIKNGQMFEGWEIVRLIGEGSYGKVYEIKREGYGVSLKAALKHMGIPKGASEVAELISEGMTQDSASTYFRGYVEEFAKECEIMSKLKGNAHIVSFEDYKIIERKDTIGWDILIRMELLTPIVAYMNNHTLERDEILKLGIDICDALELCKKLNIMHRDIKPANIFVSSSGDFKLGDFGISRIVSKTTGASTKVGTKDYMAPEIYKDDKYDASVDIYSLGVMLYRFFNNNRLPFMPPAPAPISYSDREAALSRRIRGETIPQPVNGDADIYQILSKAMAYNPSERYKDPSEMRRDLERVKMGQHLEAPVYEKTEYLDPITASGKAANNSTTTSAFDSTMIVTPQNAANGGAGQNQHQVQSGNQFQQGNNSFQQGNNNYQQVNNNASQGNQFGQFGQMGANNQQKPKKKKRLPVVLGLIGGVFLLFIVIVVLGGNASQKKKNTTTGMKMASGSTGAASTTKTADTSDSGSTSSDTALQQGDFILASNILMVGDTVNARFVLGDWIITYSPDIKFDIEDESVARVRQSSDGERYVIEGLSPGSTKITMTDGTYTDTETVRVVDKNYEVGDMCGMDFFNDDTFSNMLNGGYITIDDGASEVSVSSNKSSKVVVDIFGYFNSFGLDVADIGSSIYIYGSENIQLSYKTSIDNGTYDISIESGMLTDASGEATVILLDKADDKVIWQIKIPIENTGIN